MGLPDRPLRFRVLALLVLWVAGASLTAALALGSGGSLQAQSTPPTTFHGTVTAPDGDVEGGLEVIATISGVVCSEDEPSLTLPPNGNDVAVTSYRVNVLSDDAKEGCGTIGAEVRFQVGERMAQETGIWLGQPQNLDLTLEAGPTEPEETPQATATPQEPVEPTETPEGTATPQEPVEPTETPEATATEATETVEATETPEATATEATETVEATETPEATATEATETVEATETPEATATEAAETAEPTETPQPTEAAATEEATPTPEPTAVATATAAATATPVATEATRPDEAGEPEEPPEPQETEPAVAPAEDDGGVSAVVIALAVVAGLAMVGVGVFSWLGQSRPTGGVQPAPRREPVIGAGPAAGRRRRQAPSLSSVRDAVRSLFRRQ